MAPDKLTVVTPGVDVEQFQPAAPNPAVRERLGWSGRRVVLTAGRLQQRKGHDCLIRALPEIRRHVPDILYAIAGDGERRATLESLAHSLNVQDCVQFLGELSDSNLIECFQQCELAALPNREVNGDFEGFGMVLVEAQACGRPVLAGTSGGTAETLRPGESGRLVNCERPEPLAQALIEMLNDSKGLDRMGAAARDWAVRQFDWELLAARAAEVFQSLTTVSQESHQVSGARRSRSGRRGPQSSRFMKEASKRIANAMALALVLAPWLIFQIEAALIGRSKAFPGWSQAWSLLPGLAGVYLRRAFYRLVLPQCGVDAHIGFGTIFSHSTARVGPRVYIGPFCVIGDVTLEADALIGSNVSIINGRRQHSLERLDVPIREQPNEYPRVTIGTDSWIGDRAMVTADVGKHCVVGAASVVTKSLPDFSIVAGNPARVVGDRREKAVSPPDLRGGHPGDPQNKHSYAV